jgi:hypothetical protein
MKKLLMSAIVLSSFAIALTLFQISCQKEATAQTGANYVLTPATTTTLGGVIVGSGLSVTNVGVLSVASGSGGAQLGKVIYKKWLSSTNQELWICNYDGTGATKVNLVLPSGVGMGESAPQLSPNGQKIFFTAGSGYGATLTHPDLYTSNADGSNLVKIGDNGGGFISLGSAN